jgi:methionyl-tRNA synthetase
MQLLIPFQKEAAKAGGSSTDSKTADKEESKEKELPLRGKVAEEQAPPPAAAP